MMWIKFVFYNAFMVWWGLTLVEIGLTFIFYSLPKTWQDILALYFSKCLLALGLRHIAVEKYLGLSL